MKQLRTNLNGSWILTRSLIGCALLFVVSVPLRWNCGCHHRREHNEQAAIETLRRLAIAQEQIRAFGSIDRDGDGQTEYGWFAELAGSPEARTGPALQVANLGAPFLTQAFRHADGHATPRPGYRFELWLPARAPRTQNRDPNDPGVPTGRSPRATTPWRCYAWPDGTRGSLPDDPPAFMTDQRGPVRSSRPRGNVPSSPSFAGALPRLGPDDGRVESTQWAPVR